MNINFLKKLADKIKDRNKRLGDYHDFRPILAELEERPPNPLGSFFLWTILALMAVLVAGMFLFKVDVVITGRGKVIPIGDVKVVQPLETGVVTGICVKEGDFVKKDDVLLEIDPSVDLATLAGKDQNLKISQLSMERINAVLNNKGFSPRGKYSAQAVQAQQAQYRAQREVYDSTLQEKEKAYNEAGTELITLKEEIRQLTGILAVLKEDERRQKELAAVGAVAENRYREKMKERMSAERELDVKKGQADQLSTKLTRIKDEMQTFKSSFREKLLADYTGNLQERNSLDAEVSALKFKQDKRFITAPVSGYVNQLQTKTVGGVVTTAQQVASIVPENTPLQVKAMVLNKDIGLLKQGQKVVVKVDAFEFQKYGALEGVVETISPSSVEEKAGANRDNSESQDREAADSSGSGYPVFVKIDSTRLRLKNETFNILPGMTVTAEINIGKRRVIEFFLYPILHYIDTGLKVR